MFIVNAKPVAVGRLLQGPYPKAGFSLKHAAEHLSIRSAALPGLSPSPLYTRVPSGMHSPSPTWNDILGTVTQAPGPATVFSVPGGQFEQVPSAMELPAVSCLPAGQVLTPIAVQLLAEDPALKRPAAQASHEWSEDALPETCWNPGPQFVEPCGPQAEPPPTENVPLGQAAHWVLAVAVPGADSWPAPHVTAVNGVHLRAVLAPDLNLPSAQAVQLPSESAVPGVSSSPAGQPTTANAVHAFASLVGEKVPPAQLAQTASADVEVDGLYPSPDSQLGNTAAHGSASVAPLHVSPAVQLVHFGPPSVRYKPLPGGQSEGNTFGQAPWVLAGNQANAVNQCTV